MGVEKRALQYLCLYGKKIIILHKLPAAQLIGALPSGKGARKQKTMYLVFTLLYITHIL